MTTRARVYSGEPGHFIAARRCCFHLTTRIGDILVSSVGCYHPLGASEEEPVPIGSSRLFETMVFRIGENGEADWSDSIDSAGYMTAGKADAGHEAMLRKWEDTP